MNTFFKNIICEKEREAAGIIMPDESELTHLQGRSLSGAIRKQADNAVIAEIKFRSPSGGEIAPFRDPRIIAGEYIRGRCTAISVLTDEKYFGGKKEYLTEIADVSSLPVLRKDFIVSEKQVYETKMLKADALLLVAGILGDRLSEFSELALSLSMESLVEVRTEKEADLAVSSGAEIIGINNRDLNSMKVSLEKTAELSGYIRNEYGNAIIISESGYSSTADIVSMKKYCDGFLIGSSLMESGNRTEKLEEFVCA